jgi:hypothetical protein
MTNYLKRYDMTKSEGLTLKFFLDTEFNDEVGNGRMELISIALVSENGEREYYAESSEFSEHDAHPWLHEHVLGKLGDKAQRLPVTSITEGLKAYFMDAFKNAPGNVTKLQIWAKNGAMDQAMLGLTFGGLARFYEFMTTQGIERSFFHDTNELRMRCATKVAIEGRPNAQLHHALWDARTERLEYIALQKAILDQKQKYSSHFG